MAKTVTPGTKAVQPAASNTLEQRVIAFAEQLGRIASSVQARTDGWLDRHALNDQLTRIRDGATDLLGHFGGASPRSQPQKRKSQAKNRPPKAKTAPRAAASTGRSGGQVDAPGKTHRKAPKRARSVKHSDETIPKGNAAHQSHHDRRRG